MPGNNANGVLSVVIIGCGDIAGGYDETADNGLVLSHAGAYSRHPGYRIAACIDPDETRRQAFADHWNVLAGYEDLETCLAECQKLDVASICAPTEAHGPILEHLLTTQVQAVFCEKPMTADIDQSKQLIDDYNKAGKLICVNYLRRWDPEMSAIRDELADGRWGDVRSIAGFYTKGLRHTGSHMIDLLQFLLGPLEAKLVLRRTYDFAEDDATTDALLATSAQVPVYLIGGDSNDYTRFEVIISCEKGVIEIVDSGFQVRRRTVEPHRNFPGRDHINGGTVTETGLDTAMALAVDNLHAAVTEGTALASDGHTALAAETLCHELSLLPAIGEPT